MCLFGQNSLYGREKSRRAVLAKNSGLLLKTAELAFFELYAVCITVLAECYHVKLMDSAKSSCFSTGDCSGDAGFIKGFLEQFRGFFHIVS